MLMGPNSLRILEELLARHPLTLSAESTVLDLGCGKGLTSFTLAKETGAKVYANDLWISAEDNAKRFSEWGVDDRIIPVHEDANDLHFEKGRNKGGLKKEPTDRGRKTGSVFHWRPDRQVFTDINIPVEYYRDVLKRQAVVNKGITFRFRNQVGKKFEEETFCYQEGIREYIEELVGDNAFTMPVFWETERRGRDAENRPEMKLKITASFCFSKKVSHIEYYHNSSWLEYGGSPDKAVRSGFVAAFDKFLRESGKYNKNEQ